MLKWFKWLFSSVPKYRIVDNGEKTMSSILIESGKYKGLQWRYGCVQIPDGDESTTLLWIYEMDIGNDPGEDDEKFRQIQGDILMELLEKGLSNDDGVHLVG